MNTFRFFLLFSTCLLCFYGTTVASNSDDCNSTESGGTCTQGNIVCNNISPSEQCIPTVLEPKNIYHVADIDDCIAKYPPGTQYSQSVDRSTANFSHYPYNHDYFQMELDWDDADNAEAYYIEISSIPQTSAESTSTKEYLSKSCRVGKSASNITIVMQYSFAAFSNNCGSKSEFLIKIRSLPSDGTIYVNQLRHKQPDNCFDITDDETICGPRTPKGLSISIEAELLPNDTSQMSVTMKWNNPPNTIFNVTLYNIIIFDTVSPTLSYFLANNTRSVVISPLDRELEYNFNIVPIQKTICNYECIEVNHSFEKSECAPIVRKLFSYVPPSSSPSPSPSSSPAGFTVSPPSLRLTSSSSFVEQTSPPSSSVVNSTLNNHIPLQEKYIKEIAGGVSLVVLVVIVFGIIVTVVIIKQKCPDRPPRRYANGEDTLKPSSSDDSSAPSTRSTTPMSPWSPLPTSSAFKFVYPEEAVMSPTSMEPIYYKDPPSNNKLVLVIESLRLSKEDSLFNCAFLGDQLNQHSDIHVLQYNKCSRETASEWLMKRMMKADVVLCVCTKEFCEEWDGNYREGSLVYSLFDYVVGCKNKGQSLSNKYITIIYEEEHRNKYIPMVFNSVRHCLIKETDKLYGLITQTPDMVVL